MNPSRILARELRFPSGRWGQIASVLIDVGLIVLNAGVVFHIRYSPNWFTDFFLGSTSSSANLNPPVDEYFGYLILYTSMVVLACQSQGLYQQRPAPSGLDEVLAVFKAVVLATVVLIVFLYVANIKSVSRLVVGWVGVSNVVTLSSVRLWMRQRIAREVAEGRSGRNALIVGANQQGKELAQYLEKYPQLGYRVCGFVDVSLSSDPRVLGTLDEFSQVARTRFVEEIFIASPLGREAVTEVALEARRNHWDVRVIPEALDGLGWRRRLDYLGEFPTLSLYREPIPAFFVFVKRAMDVVSSVMGLLLLSPVLLLIAVAIRLNSSGPIIYASWRVGRKGRVFRCYKYRSMTDGAERLKAQLLHLNERVGPLFKMSRDPRLTRVGRFLRKYSLDELPQLLNVLKGEMSLVGPRPPLPEEVDQYNLQHLRRLDVTPGITGLWQVSARTDPSFETTLALDIEYIENWSLLLDLKILIRTMPVVLRGTGA